MAHIRTLRVPGLMEPISHFSDAVIAGRTLYVSGLVATNEGAEGVGAAGGTANFIVPLGLQYLELIAVVEPAEVRGSHLGARVMEAVREGKTFVAWALRTTDLDALRAKLLGAGWDLPPAAEGSRRRPDGQVLSWRTQDVEKGAGPTAIPFVIEWKIPDGLHPGEAAATHDHGTTSFKRGVVAR